MSAPCRQRGFTLVEVLLAGMLLAMGMMIALASVRSAGAISVRGEQLADANERMRAVHALLRRQLGKALPVKLQAVERDVEAPSFFIGGADHLQFAAEVPAYLGQGGVYQHTLGVAAQGGGQVLQLQLQALGSDAQREHSPARAPDVLVAQVRSVKFSYRGLDPQTGRLLPWQDTWTFPQRLPLWVSVEVSLNHGGAWPPLIVRLPQNLNRGGT